MLVVNQMRGNWKAKTKLILPLHTKAKSLACGMDIAFEWIPREENTEDELSRFYYRQMRNKIVQEKKKWQEAKEKYFQI
jgi:hypothetical protein